jgi:hypothetical protein
MHEQEKLNEARHFLAGMMRSVEDPTAFGFELSAFLSSARSVLQYAFDEAKTKTGGQAWYQAHISSNPVLSFFKDKRDMSIHYRPVVPAATINVAASDLIRVSEAVLIRCLDDEGNLVSKRAIGSQTPPSVVSPPPSVSRVYKFPDWPGQEDVPQLCRDYIAALEVVVNDGYSQGLLT